MKYTIEYRGTVLKGFDTVGDRDAYLADRVQEWTEQGPGYRVAFGLFPQETVELITDRGNKVVLVLTSPARTEEGAFE